MIATLRKLKGRSISELLHRGRQKACIFAERAGLSGETRGISDEEFLRSFQAGLYRDQDSLFTHFRERKVIFYPSFLDKDATLSALRDRFPDEIPSIIAAADRICEGRFDLLGYCDLDFGWPIPDWHFEPVSGIRSPLVHWSEIDETDPALTGDKKVIWELNRHQYFTLLGRAYWITGDEKYTDVFIGHLKDWLDSNPPKVGVNWLSGLEIAFRSISWIWAFHFFCDSPRFGSETFLKMVKGLHLNARHLSANLSTYSSPNTHLTGEALGLYFIGTFLRETAEANRWRDIGSNTLLKALDHQIRADGGYVEQSTQYHRYTADFYLSFEILTSAEGLSGGGSRETLKKLLRFLALVCQPDGRTPLVGDDDGGRLHFLDSNDFDDFRWTISTGAALLKNPELKYRSGDAGPELLWLLGPAGLAEFDRLETAEPCDKAVAFHESGWFVLRDNWSPASSYLLMDCGTHGYLNGGHAHADALGFVYSANGVPVFVDPGTYCYTADPANRDKFRGTGAHNCVTVDGESSSIPAGPFSWRSQAETTQIRWEPTDAAAVLRGTHNGYERLGVKYEREFEYRHGDCVVITDELDSEERRMFEVRFTLHPMIDVTDIFGSRIVLRQKGGNDVLLTVDTNVEGEEIDEVVGWRAESADISPRYGASVASNRLVFVFRGQGRLRVCTKILPTGAAK